MKAKALIFVGILAAASFAAVQDSLQLARTYKEGEKDAYTVKIDIAIQGGIEVTTSMSQEVVKVYDNGDADVKFTYGTPKAMMGGQDISSMAGQMLNMPPMTMRLNKYGSSTTKPTVQQGMMAGMHKMMSIGSTLLDKPMKVGQAVPINVEDKEAKSKVTGTITLESITGGVAKIVSDMQITNAQTTDKPMKLKTTALIDVASSKPNRVEGLATDVPGQGGMAPDSIKFTLERAK
jgi:hypothetical protein